MPGGRLRAPAYCVAVACALALTGCVTQPPVQEMSDARQAIGVAKDAGADETANAELRAAEDYLSSAERKLSEKSYSQARRDALLAKDKALEALAEAEAAAEQNQPK